MAGIKVKEYSGGYDLALFPFLKEITPENPHLKLIEQYRHSATELDKQRISAGMMVYGQLEMNLLKELPRELIGSGASDVNFRRMFVAGEKPAPGGWDDLKLKQLQQRYTPSQLSDLRKKAEELEYATAQRGAAQSYIQGKKDTAGDTLKGLLTFAGIATGMYGITSALAGGSTGISSWLSKTFGVPSGATQAAGAASTVSDIGGVISGGSGVATLGSGVDASADALGGASTFSQILSGASTVGKVAGAIGSVFNLLGGSGAAGAYGTFLEAQAARAAATGKARDYNEQAESYDYLASQAGRNRQASLQNYVAERQRLAVESGRIERATKRAISSTIAAYGASGVALESGSAQEVLMDSAAEGELDLAIENFNSKQKQRSYLIEADALAEEAAFNVKRAARARENAALTLEAGNSISDMLRKQGTVQGIEAGVNIIKGAGNVASSVKSVLDLF